MRTISRTLQRRRWQANAVDEAISLGAGMLFTLGLVVGMAHFGRTPRLPPVQFDELRAMSVPLDTPPPAQPHPEPTETVLPLTGIEPGASDSPVKIAVVPPDLESLFPKTNIPPSATIQPIQFYPDLKPKTEISGDFQQVFQAAEVDQIPRVVVRPDPIIPNAVRKDAAILRVSVLFVVNINGSVVEARVLRPSGNPEFDAIIIQSMTEDWTFTPAIKRGKKVRCMMQETVAVHWGAASRFSL